jgi:hypothetical protein
MCFLGVSDVCCKCFNCFGRMLKSVSSMCCKSKSGVAHVALGPSYRNCAWEQRGRKRQAQATERAQIEIRSPHGPRKRGKQSGLAPM